VPVTLGKDDLPHSWNDALVQTVASNARGLDCGGDVLANPLHGALGAQASQDQLVRDAAFTRLPALELHQEHVLILDDNDPDRHPPVFPALRIIRTPTEIGNWIVFHRVKSSGKHHVVPEHILIVPVIHRHPAKALLRKDIGLPAQAAQLKGKNP
jgi:hypothetical protein